ncbi:MAG: hypothetical protein DRR16_03815 [Candidatus Parabeggiatoa sp. nov. 3]|nr:MAG: hypothetical protein DRR16_03815 [Gammaproteobacteria bacterium]
MRFNIFMIDFARNAIGKLKAKSLNYARVQYTLNYPNFEVKQAFITYLFESFTNNGLEEIQPAAKNLRRYLQAENVEGFMTLIRALFAKIPYLLHYRTRSLLSFVVLHDFNLDGS